MNPADEMAAKIRPSERQLAGAGAGSDEKSDQQLRTILENLRRVNPVEQDDLHSGIADRETSERRAIYSRLVAIEKEMKRRGSRTFTRYVVAILIGVAATLAWQSYGDAAKRVVATSAPKLAWSPEAKQMIASWVQQLGWTKSPAGSEKIAAPVAQTAPTTSLDSEKVQQTAQNLVAVRETVQELAAGQKQVMREIDKLESAVMEILEKIPAPPPQPPGAPARKPISMPPTARAPGAPPESRAPIPPPHP
jgi:hypothetical protein